MYHHIAILVFGLAMVAAEPPKGPKTPCMRIAHGGFKCCKKELFKMPPSKEDFKECFQLMKKPPNCDVAECMAKKRGHLNDDGTFKIEKIIEDTEKNFENNPELVNDLKENCIKGDLSKYGPADFCDLMKQKICFDVHITKSCNEWNDEGDCNGIKEAAAECVKQFS